MIKVIHAPLIKVKVLEPNNIKVTFKQILIGEIGQEYDGEYIIIPRFQDQTLYTKDKKLIKNVVVKQIPTYEALNSAGGFTITIGEE